MSQASAKIRAAVIGIGWAGQQHLKGYLSHDDVEVVGVADTAEVQLHEVQKQFELSAGFTDYRELLDETHPDVVSVGTPNFAHAEPAIEALDRGIHVLIEKPLARSYAEGLKMVEAAQHNDRVLQVVFNHRYRPDVITMKRFVDQGGVGEIYHAKSRWLRRSGIPGDGLKWFSSRELSGGGPLIDLGVHMLDMALHIMGEPEVESVSAATYNLLGRQIVTERSGEEARFDVEDFATSFIRLAGGKTLTLEASWALHREDGDLLNLILYGERGGAEMVSKGHKSEDSVRFYSEVSGVHAEITPVSTDDGNSIPGHERVVRQFIDRVREGSCSQHHGQEGLLRTWIIDAIYRSARESREIKLSELKSE